MFIEKYKDVDLSKYNDFLRECSKKDYSNIGTHEHHILPKFMGGSDDMENLIKLSYQDHFDAHMILANCFPEDSKEYKGNIFSAHYVNNWIDSPIDLREKISQIQSGRILSEETRRKCGVKNIGRLHTEDEKQRRRDTMKKWLSSSEGIAYLQQRSENMMGENNPFFGKSHTEETKSKKSESMKKYRGVESWNYGRKFTEEHRNKLSTSKKEYYENNEHWNSGKSWSDEVKKKISDSNLGKEMSESNKEQLSNRMKGNDYAKTRKCSIDGIEFNSMAAASRYHNKPVDWISVRLKSNKLEFQNWYFL